MDFKANESSDYFVEAPKIVIETSNEVNISQTSNEVNISQTSNEVNIVQTSNEVIAQTNATWERPLNNQIHFMNASRMQYSVFSCAVDSFLEVSYTSLGSFLNNSDSKSEFFERLNDCLNCYNHTLNSDTDMIVDRDQIEYELATMRQPVWDYLAQNCQSFANRDCDAQFSDIFSSAIFNNLLEKERNLFQTCYKLLGTCMACDAELLTQCTVMLNYVSELELNSLEKFDDWPLLLDPLVQNKSLSCTCGFVCDDLIADTRSVPKICVIEFQKQAIERKFFSESITIHGQNYLLKGLVRHQ